MRYTGLWILTLAILLAAGAIPARANLIVDPGFESCVTPGDAPPGWTASSADAYCSNFNTHGGSWSGEFMGTASSLSQTITTTAGDNYDFSFWLRQGPCNPDFFTASFGSDEVLDLTGVCHFVDYAQQDFTVTATWTSTTIQFDAETGSGVWNIDNVSVTDLGPSTPEPASVVLLASGLLAIAWHFHRGRRAI